MLGRLVLFAFLISAGPALAGDIVIGFLTQPRPPVAPVSPLDREVTDEGVAGARLGLRDDQSTGRFTHQAFRLQEMTASSVEEAAERAASFSAGGGRFLVADLDARMLHAAADTPAAKDLVILNARAADDALRAEGCGLNLLHTMPSRAMLADALAQYLALKRWNRWFVVVGPAPADRLYADAVLRAAGRFGAEVVASKDWTFRFGQGRTDSGHVTLQTEIPALTQGPDYDVLVVADEGNAFGEFLEGRTALPRPVAGTHGLTATAFSPVSDAYGATQLQDRFARAAGRRMGPVDYAAWAAVRAVGEAAVRARSDDPAAIAAYLRGPEFELSGFKGQGQSFRDWDGQMRQPILIAGPRMLVSVAPEPGFLHPSSPLDTLGVDREESRCALRQP